MTKEEIIKDIMLRRGALHVINEHRFYSEASVINCLQEAFGLLPQPYVSGSLPCELSKQNDIDCDCPDCKDRQ